jgi:ribosomal protein S19E (S16A)
LNLLAEGTVNLFVLAEPQEIHFSIFGDRHVLLQDKHHHPTEKKWVWFIECPSLVRHLRLRVEELFSRARQISATSFDSFLSSLYAYETAEIARNLLQPRELPLVAYLNGIDEDQQRAAVKRLDAIGFVAEQVDANGRSCYELTGSGTQWLRDIYET